MRLVQTSERRLRVLAAAIVSVVCCLVGARADATLVDRRSVATPTSNVLDGFSGRIVASEAASMFLAQGQRVTSEGMLVDAEPVPGAEGHAVAWRDGWIVIHAGRELDVRHLGVLGPAEPLYRFPSNGVFLDAASSSGRIVILENDRRDDDALWLSVADDQEVLRRVKLGRARDARVISMWSGFLLVSWTPGENSQWTFVARRLDREGNPILERTVGKWSWPADVFLTAGDERVLLLTSSYSGRHTIIDEELSMTPPVMLNSRYAYSAPLAMGSRFVIPYGVREGSSMRDWRAWVLRDDGTTESDAFADAIAGGDRLGTRYLVARPWGDAAIAEDDPRRVVSEAVRLRRRDYDRTESFETVTSGDVTLVAFGPRVLTHFVRVDASGRVIDSTPQPMPSVVYRDSLRLAVAATPEGFAFLAGEDHSFRIKSLARRGGWSTSDPIVIEKGSHTYGSALHGNADGLLVVWLTEDEILTVRLTHDGIPLQLLPDRFPQPPRGRDITLGNLWITGAGSRWLILIQQSYCVLGTCSPDFSELHLQALVLGPDGRMAGSPIVLQSLGSVKPVALHDGTWVIPFSAGRGVEILHVATDGSVLDRIRFPELTGGVTDAVSTATGWQAILGSARLLEVEGAATAKRMTGLTLPRIPEFVVQVPPRFGAGGRLVYLDDSEMIGSVPVPWTARVAADEGDLSIRITDLGRRDDEHFFSVAVQNKSAGEATSVIVTDLSTYGSRHVTPVLAAGEVTRFILTSVVPRYGVFAPRFVVGSDNVADMYPEDNFASFDDAQPAPGRARPVHP